MIRVQSHASTINIASARFQKTQSVAAPHDSPSSCHTRPLPYPVAYQYYGTADGTKLAHAMKQYQLPRGNGMRFEYYANGRVFRHTPFDTAGTAKPESATTFAWTEFRREARQTDGLGNERRFLFDANGNPLSITDEAGAETTYTYDPTAGRTYLRLTRTDPQGMTTSYGYDSLGNLSDVTLPSGRTLAYRDHTAYGQPQRVKDADGNWTLHRLVICA